MHRSLDKTLVKVNLEDGTEEVLSLPAGYNKFPTKEEMETVLNQLDSLIKGFQLPYTTKTNDE